MLTTTCADFLLVIGVWYSAIGRVSTIGYLLTIACAVFYWLQGRVACSQGVLSSIGHKGVLSSHRGAYIPAFAVGERLGEVGLPPI